MLSSGNLCWHFAGIKFPTQWIVHFVGFVRNFTIYIHQLVRDLINLCAPCEQRIFLIFRIFYAIFSFSSLHATCLRLLLLLLAVVALAVEVVTMMLLSSPPSLLALTLLTIARIFQHFVIEMLFVLVFPLGRLLITLSLATFALYCILLWFRFSDDVLFLYFFSPFFSLPPSLSRRNKRKLTKT